MSVILRPGDLGIDYSYARPDLLQAAKSGARFVLRYTAGAASLPGHPSYNLNKGKLITPDEFQAILKTGMDVIANDEWYVDRVTEGSSAGAEDGAAALKVWKQCGYAKGATIYVSWDQDPSQAKFTKVAAYIRAYKKALGGYYQLDAYAGTGFLKWAIKQGLIRFGWRPNASSWSNDGLPYQPDTSTASKRDALLNTALAKTPAHIWQTGNYWFGKSADEDMILRIPVGSHREALSASTPIVPPAKPPVIPPVPSTIDGKEFVLDADAKARFDRIDAEIADIKHSLLGAFKDSKGRPHVLRTWLTKMTGKKVDITN